MPLGRERRYYLKLKAAYFCYEKGYSQTDVAEMLGISRPTLGKLLTEARDEGIVKIQVVDPLNLKHVLSLEQSLKEHFGLADVHVIDPIVEGDDSLNQKLARSAAEYLDGVVRSGMKIASAWGYTLEMMSNYLRPNPGVKDIEVYTLMGGAGTSDSVRQPDIIAQHLLHKYAGTGYIINAPYLCHSEELCDAIKKEPSIADVLLHSRDADLTLVGIGETPTLEPAYIARYYYDEDDIRQLMAAGAVGDICANFFDINGRPCDVSLKRRIVGIDIDDLHRHKNVVAISGGPKKYGSVLGALRGGYVNVLITDRFTAEAVLKA